jgi:hypothetical protein
VRKEAGIDGLKMADALRHSFGTYLLATENNIDSLRSDMGHEHIRVFLNHYHKAVTADEAAPYWNIHPPLKPPASAAKKAAKKAKKVGTKPNAVKSSRSVRSDGISVT